MTGLDPDPALLRDLAAIGVEPEDRFERITRTASAMFGTKAAFIGLLDGEQQWTKGCVGLESALVARQEAFCRHVVGQGSLLVVPDLRLDSRFAADEIVIDGGFRFYAGQPVRVRGHLLGALGLLDNRVRDFSPSDRSRVADLACWAETEILAIENELRERRRTGISVPHPGQQRDELVAATLQQEFAERGGERRAVERMKDEFVSVVSHELRTPLTSIRGSLGLLASGRFGELPAQGERLVQIALDNTERLVRLVNDILDLERIEAGRADMHTRVQPLVPVLDAARDAVAGAAEEIGVTVTTSSSPIWVSVDADFLVRALTNLIGNAVKFSPPGAAVTVDAVGDATQIRISVADAGRGIPADRLDRIFERFEQVDASDAREKGGTGLGLAIARSIVERHGGRIEVDSEVGVGSTFSIVLPAPSPAPGPPR